MVSWPVSLPNYDKYRLDALAIRCIRVRLLPSQIGSGKKEIRFCQSAICERYKLFFVDCDHLGSDNFI